MHNSTAPPPLDNLYPNYWVDILNFAIYMKITHATVAPILQTVLVCVCVGGGGGVANASF
jgi:hypothetical protein